MNTIHKYCEIDLKTFNRYNGAMIPYALLNCLIDGKEIRILDVSVFHIVIRSPYQIEKIKDLKINVFINSDYKEININHFSCLLLQENEFDYEYKIEIEDELYAKSISRLMEEVQQYILYKQNEEQEKITDYPIELDSIYPSSYDALLSDLFNFNVDKEYEACIQHINLGYCLDCFEDYQQFIELDLSSFKNYYFHKIHLDRHPLKNLNVNYIYIGNQFCSHLYPSLSMLKKMIEKCKQFNLKVVFMFSTMKQHEINQVKKIMEILKSYSVQEIVINDFGMIEMNHSFQFTLGILLNKHVKDTRIKYQSSPYITQTSLNTDSYQAFLMENHITRYSYESCGYKMDMVRPVDLYFPRFQMNTSGYCTMYAKCHNSNRANQEEIKSCEQYCKNQYFLYPTHLKMIGKYNSLFGYDERMLKDAAYLKQVLEQVDRMILSV